MTVCGLKACHQLICPAMIQRNTSKAIAVQKQHPKLQLWELELTGAGASRAAHSSGEDGGSRTAAIKRRPLPCWRNRTFHNTTHCQGTSTFLSRTGLQVYDVFELTQRSWLLMPLRQPTTLHLESSRTFDNAHAQKRPCCTLRIGSIMK